MKKKFTLNYSEFYVTNVCNLNCPRCNRYNNYKFKGHWRWQDHEADYQKWSEILHINRIGIIGGEPLLNPDFPNWVEGLASLWPESTLQIITNGTQMKLLKKHLPTIKKYSNRTLIDISVHNCDWMSQIILDAKEMLQSVSERAVCWDVNNETWQTSYNNVKEDDWPLCPTYQDFKNLPIDIQEECRQEHNFDDKIYERENFVTYLKDEDNLRFEIKPSIHFENSALIRNEQNTLRFHKSDPHRAVSVCPFKPCHHFMNGKLYKCGPVGLFPEFVKQFVVQRDSEQDALIHSYVPAEHGWSDQNLQKFIDGLIAGDAISQCSLCPEVLDPQRFAAGTKKIKINQID